VSKIYRIPVSKAQLRAIPTDERNLLLLSSHAVNQLSVMRRLLIFSLNYESANAIENTLSAAQSQTILRFLFGALAEAWEMTKRPINQKLIGTDYINVIEKPGVEVYEALKKHFGTSNILHTIRNEIVFHYPKSPDLDAAFNEVPEDEDWAWYASTEISNSFYLASDYVISAGILRATGETDTETAFKKIMGIVIPVSNDMTDFFLYLMRAIVSRHLGAAMLSPTEGTKIENAPGLYSFSIPFFTTDDRNSREGSA
jgi:hypothetical protein